MFAYGSPSGLTIDLLLSGYRLSGVCREVDEKLRLSDVLNSSGGSVVLYECSVLGLKGQLMASLSEVTVQSRQVLAAVPKETEDYKRYHQIYRAGMARPALVRIPVLALLPPYAATGKVHLPSATDLSDPTRAGLPPFFALTDVTLFMGEERLYQGPVMLLNRDLVAVLGRTGEDVHEDPPAPAESEVDPFLDDALAVLKQPLKR